MTTTAAPRRLIRLLLLLLVLLLTGAMSAFVLLRLDREVAQTVPPPAAASGAPLDLARPDALIVTRSLSRLPRDLLAVPLLKKLLTEEFVFHYEQTEGRLGLRGTLRRIAYEHELALGDEVLAYVLDAPAQLALWKSHDGKLRHYLLSVDRGPLMKALEFAAKVALDDSQLKLLPDGLLLPGQPRIPVYQLSYAYERKLFFADFRGRLLVFSDAELLLPESAPPEHRAEREAQVRAFLEAARPQEAMLTRFDVEPASASSTRHHTVAVSAEYLSFGYQRFFPAIDAVRFDFDPKGWATALRLGAPLPSTDALWRVVPTAPALCSALPVEKSALAPLAGALIAGDPTRAVVEALESLAAVCWYHGSAVQAPLVVMRATGPIAPEALKLLFEAATGGPEAGYQIGPEEDAPYERYPPFAVTERECPGGRVWQREVSSKYGQYDADTSDQGDRMRSPRFFRVTLAYCNGVLAFSPDDRLVEKTVAVLQKNYPALADAFPGGDPIALALYPRTLAELLGDELKRALPADQEPVFHDAVTQRFMPQLAGMKEFPAYALRLLAGASGRWTPVSWQPLEGR